MNTDPLKNIGPVLARGRSRSGEAAGQPGDRHGRGPALVPAARRSRSDECVPRRRAALGRAANRAGDGRRPRRAHDRRRAKSGRRADRQRRTVRSRPVVQSTLDDPQIPGRRVGAVFRQAEAKRRPLGIFASAGAIDRRRRCRGPRRDLAPVLINRGAFAGPAAANCPSGRRAVRRIRARSAAGRASRSARGDRIAARRFTSCTFPKRSPSTSLAVAG